MKPCSVTYPPQSLFLFGRASRSMSTSSDIDVTFTGYDLVLRLACAAYLARFTGSSRIHCGSDLRLYFTWCTERHLLPLLAVRAEIERYVRWMQETRRFKPSTVARRTAVVTGFYRTCIIDGCAAIACASGGPETCGEEVVQLCRRWRSHLGFRGITGAFRQSHSLPPVDSTLGSGDRAGDRSVRGFCRWIRSSTHAAGSTDRIAARGAGLFVDCFAARSSGPGQAFRIHRDRRSRLV